MRKWNLIIDVARCTNCNNCFMAVKDEYVGNRFPGYSEEQTLHGPRWINIHSRERGSGSLMDVAHLPTMCNQCDNAPCIAAAGNGAVYKRADGIVMIDPEKARGRRELVAACPYGHIWWNEELGVPQKWFFDAHLLDAGWKEPRCAQSCATGCLSSVCCEDGAMQARVSQEQLEVLKPELGTRPRIHYRNLHRFTREFIAGSVCYQDEDTEETAAGAEVELRKEGTPLQRATTDFFGDFKFDGLEPDSGTYTINISFATCRGKSLAVELGRSVNLGAISLDARD